MSPSPSAKTNRTAIVALVLSFLGITSIFGVIAGHVARSTIRGSREKGDSLAVAALWVGYLYITAAVLCIIAYVWIVM